MAQDYQASKKTAVRIITILGVITIAEVAFALLGKGYLIDGIHFHPAIMGIVMITMSIVKAYLIVYEFMHMKYEVPGLVRSVLLPTLLLLWAIIAFLQEGNSWGDRRERVKGVTEMPAEPLNVDDTTGLLFEIPKE